MTFSVLQIRPISVDGLRSEIDWSKINESDAWLKSGCAIGPGEISGICDVVYLKRDGFDKMETRQIAAEITSLNSKMRHMKRNYILIGYGRWGSAVPSLGVPVQWSDISEAKVIVECCLEDFRIEPSQGTHFFQNMTSANAGYINVNPYSRPGEKCDTSTLDTLPAFHETKFIRAVHFDTPPMVIVDGRENRAIIK